MSSLPNSRWESRKRSDQTSGWFSTRGGSNPPGGGAEGAPRGGRRVPPPPPPRGETEIPGGGRDAGGHPVRRVPRGGPVRLRASHEERPERDALHLGGAGVDPASAVCPRTPDSPQ